MIEWNFVLKHTSRFGSLWKAPVKTFKNQFKKVVGKGKPTLEELVTITSQLRSAWTQDLSHIASWQRGWNWSSHDQSFLNWSTIGSDSWWVLRPSTVIQVTATVAILLGPGQPWWSNKYFSHLNKFVCKVEYVISKIKVGDIVCLRQEPSIQTKWPLARVIRFTWVQMVKFE